ncbi:MAG: AAA family ATPase [Pseudonocardiaceae bacterium]
MQMRLVFVRALLHRPQLLFLDEPTAGMDPANARIVKDIIRELRAEGSTVFLTTHDMSTADQLCDRVAFVVDGRIAALDSPAEHKVTRGQRIVRVTHRSPDHEGLLNREFMMDELADDEEFRKLVRAGRIQAIHSQEANLG